MTSILKKLATKNMLVVFLMGCSSGLPLLLTLRTLQAWMTESGVDLKTIGFFALAGLPYSIKFLWAPIFDRYQFGSLDRRKSWLLFSQIGIVISLILMAHTNPQLQTATMAFYTLLLSFFSASQDIVVDAYRREILADEDLGIGSSFYIYGYRLAMWISGGGALFLASHYSWPTVYLLMAIFQAVFIGVTFFANPSSNETAAPKNLQEAFISPLTEFFKRPGALLLICFVLFYKVGDNIAGNMLMPFYLKIGYSKEEIAWIAKTLSVFLSLGAGLIGGLIVTQVGIRASLYIFGILQALSTLSFASLTWTSHNLWVLGSVICFEDISAAMGSAAFVAFLGSITNKKFSATQYALFSALTNVPRIFFSSGAGVLAESVGWNLFFILCALMALPGLFMIQTMYRFSEQQKSQ